MATSAAIGRHLDEDGPPGPVDRLGGHLWTVGPTLRVALRPPLGPASRRWSALVADPVVGTVRLGGLWHEVADSDAVVVIVHGLGGDANSGYVARAAREAARVGVSSLRLTMRGADLSGEDLYHAGLSQDLGVALGSPELRRFRHALLLGYSLGGHLALHGALARIDRRLRAVAAICPPLDLAAVQRALDRARRWPYRRYVLGSLKRAYRVLARRREVPVSYRRIAQVRTIREFDRYAIVPRFGFRDVDDYYRRTSVGPSLGALETPALLVASDRDPMIPVETSAPHLRRASAALEVVGLDAGGHLYFPARTSLGLPAPGGLEAQALSWLVARTR